MAESKSHNLNLPFITAAQAQKHVTHNEAIRALDVLVQLSVLSRGQLNPPETPSHGDQYIIGDGPSGIWDGHDYEIAAFQDGAWMFYPPQMGWLCWVVDESSAYIWTGELWTQLQSGDPSLGAISEASVPSIGVNTSADSVNKLAVKSDAILFSNDDVTPGNGDMRVFINKAGETGTAAAIFQSEFSARSEIGLAGNNDFQLKTSADGVNWNISLIVDAATGSINFPKGVRHRPTQQLTRNTLFLPGGGGDGISSIWRCDAQRGPTPRQSMIANIDGDRLQLTNEVAGTYFDHRGRMNGVSFVRIWNMSKTPFQPAWIKSYISSDTLQMQNATDIAGWGANDVIQLSDPDNPTRLFAIDVSPMMQAVFGTVFPQHGVQLKTLTIGAAARASFAASPTGNTGSNFITRSLNDGAPVGRQITVSSSVPSPISNSNLVFFSESGQANAIRICLATVTALLV